MTVKNWQDKYTWHHGCLFGWSCSTKWCDEHCQTLC